MSRRNPKHSNIIGLNKYRCDYEKCKKRAVDNERKRIGNVFYESHLCRIHSPKREGFAKLLNKDKKVKK